MNILINYWIPQKYEINYSIKLIFHFILKKYFSQVKLITQQHYLMDCIDRNYNCGSFLIDEEKDKTLFNLINELNCNLDYSIDAVLAVYYYNEKARINFEIFYNRLCK